MISAQVTIDKKKKETKNNNCITKNSLLRKFNQEKIKLQSTIVRGNKNFSISKLNSKNTKSNSDFSRRQNLKGENLLIKVNKNNRKINDIYSKNNNFTNEILYHRNYKYKNNSKKKGKVKTEKKKNRMTFKCQFCESEVDDLLRHYKIYHYKMSKEIFKPQKRDTTLFYEILKNPDNMEETGIEETNKKILLRQINPNFNLKEKFDDNTNKIIYKTTQKKKSTQAIFKSPNVIKKVNNLDHSNLESNVNSEKKTFPEDNLRGSFLARSQAREYDRKIILGENLQRNENKKNKKGIY